MINIILICGGGISSRLLAIKMTDISKRMKLNLSIKVYSEIGFEKYIDNADVVLVAPQIRYMLPEFKEVSDNKGIPIDLIGKSDYASVNGEGVINLALKMIGNSNRGVNFIVQ